MFGLKWLFGGNANKEEKPAEESKGIPAGRKIEYAIFNGPPGVTAGMTTWDYQTIGLAGPDGKPLMKDGKPVVLKSTGRAQNQTVLADYIESMRGMGYDVSQEEKILGELKSVTEKLGRTKEMESRRISGLMFGKPGDKDCRVIITHNNPAVWTNETVIVTYPSMERPGMYNRMVFEPPVKRAPANLQAKAPEAPAPVPAPGA